MATSVFYLGAMSLALFRVDAVKMNNNPGSKPFQRRARTYRDDSGLFFINTDLAREADRQSSEKPTDLKEIELNPFTPGMGNTQHNTCDCGLQCGGQNEVSSSNSIATQTDLKIKSKKSSKSCFDCFLACFGMTFGKLRKRVDKPSLVGTDLKEIVSEEPQMKSNTLNKYHFETHEMPHFPPADPQTQKQDTVLERRPSDVETNLERNSGELLLKPEKNSPKRKWGEVVTL